MKIPITGLRAAGAAVVTVFALAATLRAHSIAFSVNAQVTKAGRAAGAQAGASARRFVLHDDGRSDLGVPIAGEEAPEPSVLAQTLTAALAVNGYRPAAPGQGTQLLIVYRWGCYNHEPPGFPAYDRISRIERAAVAGGAQFGNDLLSAMEGGGVTTNMFVNRDVLTTELMEEAAQDDYYLVASAYDCPAAQQGRAVLYWRTRMEAMAVGNTLRDALLTMVAASAHQFGVETQPAEWIDTPVVSGSVPIGPPPATGAREVPLPPGCHPGDSDIVPVPKGKILSYPFRD